jgi:hypothetical protein
MPAQRLRSKEVLRIRREDLVPLGSVILKFPISVGRLLMGAWECVEGGGSGVCRCEFRMAVWLHSAGVCYNVTTEKAWRCWNLDDTIDIFHDV